ncbi:MAG: thioesterase family protein [Actinomycetaceae bacterium]|nr:thioesterase family protein [Actinomycetaceae bacterium]
MTAAISVPQIHEEPTASVMRILQLRSRGHNIFEADSLPQFRETVYGGQVLGQSLMAAYATIDSQRLVHSLHAYFIRAGNAGKPLEFEVERVRDGRSFSTRRVQAIQNDRPIFQMMLSFQEAQKGLEHMDTPPEVPPPEDVPDALEIFRHLDNPVAKFLGKTVAFRARHINGNLYLGDPEVADNTQLLWLQSRHQLPKGTPQQVHQAFLAYVSDQFMLEPVLRAHKISWRNAQLAIATLDHAMWFHRPVDVNDWMLFVQRSPSACGGRGMAHTSIYSREGQLIATVAQEGMVRLRIPDGTKSWSFYSEEQVNKAHVSHAKD